MHLAEILLQSMNLEPSLGVIISTTLSPDVSPTVTRVNDQHCSVQAIELR